MNASISVMPQAISQVVDLTDGISLDDTSLNTGITLVHNGDDGTLFCSRQSDFVQSYDISSMDEQIQSIQERLDKMENLFNLCFCR